MHPPDVARYSSLKNLIRLHWLNSVTFTTCLVSSSSKYIAHTYYLYKYKEIVHFYKLGEPAPLHETIVTLWKEVIQDLEISPRILKHLDPFTVFGFETFRAGTTDSRFGAIIGIPVNFTYTDMDSINTSNILVNNEQVEWSTPAAQNLLDAIILSHEAKKFAVAREIIAVQQSDVLRKTLSYPIFIFGTHFTYKTLSEKWHLSQRSPILRTAVFCSTAFVAASLWLLQDNLFTFSMEKNLDETLSKKGPEYVKGGLEMYDKTLKRNVALRSLMGKKGETLYNDTGEYNFFANFKRLLFSERKKYFEMQLQQNMQQNM